MGIPSTPGRQAPVYFENLGKWIAWEYVGGFLSVQAIGDTPEEANAHLDKRVPEFPAMLAEHLAWLESEGYDPVTGQKRATVQ